MANKTQNNPAVKKYVKTGIIAAIVIVVAALGIWGISAMRGNGGTSVEEALEMVSTDAANAADLRIAVIRMDAIQTDAAVLKDLNAQREKYENELRDEITYRSAEGYNMPAHPAEAKDYKDDVLVIDRNLKGLDFTLAKCCHPIYGDDVFGFISINGGIKIHRNDCPNAKELKSRFPYRIVKARWAGKSQGKQYPITLRIVGHDDIGIVTNITSIINKEDNILLRAISIDSHDGLFSGMITVTVDDNAKLEALIKKIKTVKGVMQVNR